ncbi:MAG: hypothetical protein WBQ20_04950 [Methyloceanibacter sp.]
MLQLSNAFGRKPDVSVTDKSDLACQLRVRRAESHEFAIPRAQTATERASFGDKTFYGLRCGESHAFNILGGPQLVDVGVLLLGQVAHRPTNPRFVSAISMPLKDAFACCVRPSPNAQGIRRVALAPMTALGH